MSAGSRTLIGSVVLIGVLALLAVPKIVDFGDEDSLAPAPNTAAALTVDLHRVEPKPLTERLRTTGTLRANEEVDLVSEISGTVVEIGFDEGSRVAAGDLLVKIDDSELVAERERAVHRVELAERAEARQRQLLEDGVISSETYDVAQGELNVLRAELRLIEAQLAKTEIRAPFGGVVGLRSVSLGSYLSPQTRIASLNDVDPVKLDFTVPEEHAGVLEPGDEVSFRVKNADGAFEGVIYAVEPAVDAASRSLRMRARCGNPEGVLVPGAFANVEIVLRFEPEALTVPSIALVPELGGAKVFVYADGVAEARQVTTGIRTDEAVQITSGIEVGDLVITTGLLQLRSGMEVSASLPDEAP